MLLHCKINPPFFSEQNTLVPGYAEAFDLQINKRAGVSISEGKSSFPPSENDNFSPSHNKGILTPQAPILPLFFALFASILHF
jgi:hypothetical protein